MYSVGCLLYCLHRRKIVESQGNAIITISQTRSKKNFVGMLIENLTDKKFAMDHSLSEVCDSHIHFWSEETAMEFILATAQVLKYKKRKNRRCPEIKSFEQDNRTAIPGSGWKREIGRTVERMLPRNYNKRSIIDLLQAIQDTRTLETAEKTVRFIGNSKIEHARYWFSKFPNLFKYVYEKSIETNLLESFSIFQPFCTFM